MIKLHALRMNRRLFERHSRIAGNSVYDISGQGTVQTALSGALEALLVRQDRGFMRSEPWEKIISFFSSEAECQANTYDDFGEQRFLY